MRAIKLTIFTILIAVLFIAGCATSPEAESRRQAIQADIDSILAEPLDPAEFGETKRCLSDNEYRSYQALDDRHMLFEGRRDKHWINTLRSPCHDLRYGHVLVVKSFSSSRMCEMDRFQVADWFDWPWYRRWPWHWGGTWSTGMTCSLGKFQPVTEDQIEEIKAVLRAK